MRKRLPELHELTSLLEHAPRDLGVRVAHEVEVAGTRLPIHVLSLGNPDPALPGIAYVGGVHGLERIGTRVLLIFLRGLLQRLKWDPLLHRQLEMLRMVFIPLANPGGMWLNTRGNPAGVDLMRNAPLDSLERVPFLLGGQRYSNRLPWYRGPDGAPMQPESLVLQALVDEELGPRPFSLALDCHSGFGIRDRIWFPYAHTVRPFPHLAEVHALKELFDETYPTHHYVIEPQCRQYLAHGDLWDHFLLRTLAGGDAKRVFLPLTLEMGSWMWVKKSPSQLLSLQGLFNPIPLHRLQRILRRHLIWLDFLARAACGWEKWLPVERELLHHKKLAMRAWYGWHRHT